MAAGGPNNTKALDKLATHVANKQRRINEDRESRQNNVIIFNMKESENEKQVNLDSKFQKLCLEIDLKGKSPASIKRIGHKKTEKIDNDIKNNKDENSCEKEDDKSKNKDGNVKKPTENIRPIKVCFENNWDKRLFLSKLRNLKDKKQYEEVRIGHDMSVEDRDENKRLLDEAYDLNQKLGDDSNFKYKVRGPPWAMNIVKIKKN